MSRLPFPFILTGILGFILYQAAMLLDLSAWLGTGVRNHEGWFNAHLFILGWATMLAMGAIYQLLHVILQRHIYSKKLGYIQYVLFTVGLVGLLYGFITVQMHIVGIFATLAFLGILLFAYNVIITMIQANKWDAITISALCSIIYLVLTGLTGLAMGINFATGIWGAIHGRLFGAHIWLGFIGWFGLLITGFSYKMLPMFYLSHDYATKLQRVVLSLWNAAVWLGAIAFLGGLNNRVLWVALLILTIAILIYNFHLLEIKRARHKRSPGSGIRWSLISAQALGVLAIAFVVYTGIFPDRLLAESTLVAAGWGYLGGWVSFTVLSYASKIVPFLWWTYKYGSKAGQPGTPLMSNLLDDRLVNIGLGAIACCTSLQWIGLVFSLQIVIMAAGTALAAVALAYILLVGRVFLK